MVDIKNVIWKLQNRPVLWQGGRIEKKTEQNYNIPKHTESGNNIQILLDCNHRKGVSTMNWIQGIQRAIDYVEVNITEEIDYEETARQAYSSPFHFQRVFGILCGMSLGDYIRMRRISLAGEELSKGNAKIIDIALKYGYDAPESFSRAFTRFHGISPSEAKRGGKVKIFTPLSVKLTLTGGSKMDYRIEKRDAFQVVCKRKRVGKPQTANATPDITAMWQEYGMDGTVKKLIGCMPENPVMKGLLGICFSSELNAKQFPYGIGVEYDGREIDDDLEVVTIPANTYAVFTSKGKMPDAFIKTYNRIVTEFFPQSSQYEYAENVEFEVYSSADISDPNYHCEIWIAVNEKK